MSVTQPLRPSSKINNAHLTQANLKALKTTLSNMGTRLHALVTKAALAKMNLDASGDKEISDHFMVSCQLAYVIIDQHRMNPQNLTLSPYQLRLLYQLITTDKSELSSSYTISELLNLINCINYQPTLQNYNCQELVPSISARKEAVAAETNDGRISVKTGIKVVEIGKTGKHKLVTEESPELATEAIDALAKELADVVVDGKSEDKSANDSFASSSSSSSVVDDRSIRDHISRHTRKLSQSMLSAEEGSDQMSDQHSLASSSSSSKSQYSAQLRAEILKKSQATRGSKDNNGSSSSNNGSSYYKIESSGTLAAKTELPRIPFKYLITQGFFDENVVSVAFQVMRHLPLLTWFINTTADDGHIDPTVNLQVQEAALQQVVDALDLKITNDLESVRAYMLNSLLGPIQFRWAHVLQLFKVIFNPASSSLPIKVDANDIRAINAVRGAAAPILLPQSEVFDTALLRKHSDVAINQMFMLLIHSLQAALTLAVTTGRRLFVTRLPSKSGRSWLDALKTAINILRTMDGFGEENNAAKAAAAVKASREFFLDVMMNSAEFPFADQAAKFAEIASDDSMAVGSCTYVWIAVARILMLIVAETVYIHGFEMRVKPGDEQARQAAVIVAKFARSVTSFPIRSFPYEAFDVLLKDSVVQP